MTVIGRKEAVRQAREAITALAVASCDCPYETERELRDEVVRLRDQLEGAVSREHAVQAIGWLSAEVAVHGAPSLGPEWLELWDRALTATGGGRQ